MENKKLCIGYFFNVRSQGEKTMLNICGAQLKSANVLAHIIGYADSHVPSALQEN